MKSLRKFLSILGVVAIALSLMSAAPPVQAGTAAETVTAINDPMLSEVPTDAASATSAR